MWLGLGACTQPFLDVSLQEARTVTLDESKIVLRRFPRKAVEWTDSSVVGIVANQSLCRFNSNTGKNENNFDLKSFNFDSLLQKTYCNHYLGQKEIAYRKGAEMNGNNYQLLSYCKYKQQTAVLVTILCEVKELQEENRKEQLAHVLSSMTQSLPKEEMNFVIDEQLSFLFLLDPDWKVSRVVPIYAEQDNYNGYYPPYFHKNIYIDQDHLMVPVMWSDSKLNLEHPLPDCDHKPVMMNISLREPSKYNYSLTGDDIHFSGLRYQDYFSIYDQFVPAGQDLLYGNGKEVIELHSKKKLIEKELLDSTEYIFDLQPKEDGAMLLLNYTFQSLNPANIGGHVVPHDSTVSCQLKNIKDGKVLQNIPISEKNTNLFLGKKTLYSFEKDNEHYYLIRRALYEN